MKNLLFCIAFLLFFSFQSIAQKEWIIPEKYVYSINPTIESDFFMLGKDLYTKYCKSCHGDEGFGDGRSAKKLDGGVCDFSMAKFQTQADGVIFYKITFGRSNMPDHSKQLPNDVDRWLHVNYIRTLSESEKLKIMNK